MSDHHQHAAFIESASPDLVQYLRDSTADFYLAESTAGRGIMVRGSEEVITEATQIAQVLGAGLILFMDGADNYGKRLCTNPSDPQYGSLVEFWVDPPTVSKVLVENISSGKAFNIAGKLDECMPLALDVQPIHPGLIRALHRIAESDTPEAAEEADWESRDIPDDNNEEREGAGDNDPEKWEDAKENFEIDDQDFAAIEEVVAGKAEDLDKQETVFLIEAGMLEGGEATDFAGKWLIAMKNEDREDELEKGDGGTETGLHEYDDSSDLSMD